MKEPGQMAYEAWHASSPGGWDKWYASSPGGWDRWDKLDQPRWSRVESAIRADERAKVIEECAKVAEDAKRIAPLCPYGRDKPGDPTWGHTDDDICPVCHKNGHDSLYTCTDCVSGSIAAAIRAKGTEHG
jgi:hypothetical protein